MPVPHAKVGVTKGVGLQRGVWRQPAIAFDLRVQYLYKLGENLLHLRLSERSRSIFDNAIFSSKKAIWTYITFLPQPAFSKVPITNGYSVTVSGTLAGDLAKNNVVASKCCDN